VEAPRCQTCGQENPSDAQFCINRACNAYLGWQSAAPPGSTFSSPPATPPGPHAPASPAPRSLTGPPAASPSGQTPAAPAPRPRSATPGAPTQRVLARFESDHAQVDPGGKCDLGLLVRNGGTVVEQFVIAVEGIPSTWVSVVPPQVNLDVGAEQRCQITIRPPREATTPAGRTALSVSITSSVDQRIISSLPATLDVGGFTVLNSSISPFESESTRSGEHELIVTNEGNVATQVNFSGTDPADKLRLTFDPPIAPLQPLQQAFVRVLATPRRRTWFALPKRHQFSVSVTPPVGPAAQHNASLNQLARFPHWVPKALGALLVVALAAGIPLTIRQLNKNDEASAATALVKVPTVTGLSFDQAAAQLVTAGFLAEKAPEAVSEGEKDKVFAQDPAPGSEARKKSVVRLTMSVGVGKAAIADVQSFSVDDATRSLGALNLKVKTGTQPVQNRDVPQGMIVRSNPAAGTQVDVGSTVELIVSDGSPPKPLPPITGDYAQVSRDLVTAGFGVQSPPKTTMAADKTLKGTVAGCTVIDTSKPCAAREKEGTVVQLSVFLSSDTVTLADLAKNTQTAAISTITAAGLTVGSITKAPSANIPAGSVISSKPAANATVNVGGVVDLVVSGGTPIPVPNLSGQTIAAAKTRLGEMGLVAKSLVCTDSEKVTSQQPAASQQASRGDSVSLGCSRCTLSVCVTLAAPRIDPTKN
jgi:beta-lactam-binding protein with PASTA domain